MLVLPPLLVPPLPASELAALDVEGRIAAQEARLNSQNAVRTTLLQAVGGLILVVGAQATWANLQINREARNIEREGQITERFTRAIDQLGAGEGKDDVVLGGIYALDRIARDNPADREAVLQILSAYVRGHAPLLTDNNSQPAQPSRLAVRAAPVQAAMTILGTRPHLDHNVRQSLGFNLDLREANLTGANLTGANLTGANLTRANLTRANLTRANLTDANLTDANLTGAHLTGANLHYAHLTRANLHYAHLTGVREGS